MLVGIGGLTVVSTIAYLRAKKPTTRAVVAAFWAVAIFASMVIQTGGIGL